MRVYKRGGSGDRKTRGCQNKKINSALTFTLAPNNEFTHSACLCMPSISPMAHRTGTFELIDILGTEEQCHCNSQANHSLRKWFSTQESFYFQMVKKWSCLSNVYSCDLSLTLRCNLRCCPAHQVAQVRYAPYRNTSPLPSISILHQNVKSRGHSGNNKKKMSIFKRKGPNDMEEEGEHLLFSRHNWRSLCFLKDLPLPLGGKIWVT